MPRSDKGVARRSLADRFWEKVKRGGDDDCWPFLGTYAGSGYGRIYITETGKSVPAHRVALALTTGTWVSERFEVCHNCDNPKCCNPRHLFPGTHRDNMADMARKGRAAKDPVVARRKREAAACRYGHSMADCYVDPNGHRHCRSCKRAAARRYDAARPGRRNLTRARDALTKHGTARSGDKSGDKP